MLTFVLNNKRQENRILNQKLSNTEKQCYSYSCDGQEWAQKESAIMNRIEELQKEKAEAQRKMSEMHGELGAKEGSFMAKQK